MRPSPRSLNRMTRQIDRYLGGTNLEIFKFGFYIAFPIGWMYYFGTNLDNRFSVPDFWPRPETTNRVPMDPEDIKNELARLRARRLALRDKRLEREREENGEVLTGDAQSTGWVDRFDDSVEKGVGRARDGIMGWVGWK